MEGLAAGELLLGDVLKGFVAGGAGVAEYIGEEVFLCYLSPRACMDTLPKRAKGP